MTFARNGYVARRINCGSRSTNKGKISIRGKKAPTRDWWLVKHNSKLKGIVTLGTINLPGQYIGKKVRFKIEVIK